MPALLLAMSMEIGDAAPYRFVSVDKLVAEFFEDVKRWRDENSND